MEGRVDILVGGVGTGGTLSGVTQFIRSKNPDLYTVAVGRQVRSLITFKIYAKSRFDFGEDFLLNTQTHTQSSSSLPH